MIDSRKWLAAVGTAMALSLTPSVAQAGTFSYDTHFVYSSRIDDMRFDSPFTWRDDGSTSGTWIFLFGCHFNDTYAGNPEPTVELRRNRTALPDESRGTRTFASCVSGSSQNWGNQQVGTYHFKFTDFDTVVATSQLHVSSTRVSF